MRVFNKAFCFGGFFLVSTVLLCAYFTHWLLIKSDDDQVHDALVEHGKLVVRGKRQEANELLSDVLSNTNSGPLDPIWLQLLRFKRNGYEKLDFYLRILEGDPEREATYSEIANFIELAPNVFHDEVKAQYFSAMKKIPGIKREFLEKYELN